MVATGLGRLQPAVLQAPVAQPRAAAAVGVAAAPAAGGRGVGAFGTQAAPTTPGLRIAAARRPVAVATSDYSKLDEPAINRLAAAAGDGLRHDDPEADEEILDIPAFLRRQAD